MNDEPQISVSGQLTRAMQQFMEAMTAVMEAWPPERILASAIEEYNQRMAEINNR